jgi:protein-L-isoaspartate O-methyltransferase
MHQSSNQKSQLAIYLRHVITASAQKIYTDTMTRDETLVYETDTPLMHYQVVDMVYEGRQARVLFSGQREAAQSGLARDGQPELLFDYNQRFLELATSLQPKRVLLIGGGVYTLPRALLEALPSVQIDVVELDPGLDELARRFFDWQPDERVTITHADGRTFLNNSPAHYDLILIDAFSNMSIPKSLLTKQAVQQLKSHLTPNGVVGINLISAYYGRGAELIRRQYATYSAIFNHVEIFPADRSLLSFWLSQNFILIAQAGKKHPLNLRFEPLSPPTDQ